MLLVGILGFAVVSCSRSWSKAVGDKRDLQEVIRRHAYLFPAKVNINDAQRMIIAR